MTQKIDSDTSDFLTALTYSAGEDSPILDAPPDAFHPDFIEAVSRFCSAFREYCGTLGLDPDAADRSFGGNVYFTLSGHGCGFWDDSGPWGDVLTCVLEHFAGGKYRFEQLSSEVDYRTRGTVRKIDFSVYVQYLAETRAKRFAVPDLSTLPPLSLSIAFCPAKRDLRVILNTSPFVHPPYWEGEAWTLEPFAVDRYAALVETAQYVTIGI